MTALGLAFWRDLATALCFILAVVLTRPAALRVAFRDLRWFFVMGAVGIGAFHVLWNLSVLVNGVSAATVLVYIAPVFVSLAAILFLNEPATWRKGGALVLTLAGVALVSGMEGQGGDAGLAVPGLAIGVASALTHGTFSLVGKKLAGGYDPLVILAYAFGFAALTLLPFQLAAGSRIQVNPAMLLNFGALVLGASFLGFFLYISALKYIQASVASVVLTVEVLFAPTLSYLFLAERLAPIQIAGAALVICGVLLVSWQPRPSG